MIKRHTILDRLEEIGSGPSFAETICDELSKTSFFSDFDHPQLKNLSVYFHAYYVPSGTVIYTEGNHDEFLSFLVKGKIKILKSDAEHVQKELVVIRPGVSLGEMSIIDDSPHSATAVAIENSEIIILTRANLKRISETQPALANKLLWKIAWQLSVRLRQTSGLLIDHL